MISLKEMDEGDHPAPAAFRCIAKGGNRSSRQGPAPNLLAIEYLKSHGLDAIAYPVGSDRSPADVILGMVRVCNPGVVVIGAYGQPVLREFFLGSTTRTMLEGCPAPLFLYH
jgi:nucleotide-binding universal stress UspA family protein